jgi:hypothetical protein
MANNKLTEQYVKNELAVLRLMYSNIEHISGPIYYVDNSNDYNYYASTGKIINIERHTEIDVTKFGIFDKDEYRFTAFEYKDKKTCYMYNTKTDEFVADLSDNIADVAYINKIHKLDGDRLIGIYEVSPYSYYGEEQKYKMLLIDMKSKRAMNIEATSEIVNGKYQCDYF